MERLLIGNKCDCEPKRDVGSWSGEQLAWSQGIPFMETSAKTGHNIDKVRGYLMLMLLGGGTVTALRKCFSLQAFEQLAGLILRKVC